MPKEEIDKVKKLAAKKAKLEFGLTDPEQIKIFVIAFLEGRDYTLEEIGAYDIDEELFGDDL